MSWWPYTHCVFQDLVHMNMKGIGKQKEDYASFILLQVLLLSLLVLLIPHILSLLISGITDQGTYHCLHYNIFLILLVNNLLHIMILHLYVILVILPSNQDCLFLWVLLCVLLHALFCTVICGNHINTTLTMVITPFSPLLMTFLGQHGHFSLILKLKFMTCFFISFNLPKLSFLFSWLNLYYTSLFYPIVPRHSFHYWWHCISYCFYFFWRLSFSSIFFRSYFSTYFFWSFTYFTYFCLSYTWIYFFP